MDMMSDPAMCTDGHTYEKVAIEKWLSEHGTSPVTGSVLLSKRLAPNHALRNAISEFKAAEEGRTALKARSKHMSSHSFS